ncbi:metal-dependent transcriptional regulator [Methanoculleus sp. Wushi-C6]|uniref:Metal-dependent transcriptional regulator n=1 Tax=Methanoculleus caldifontis TaxID=2651577 RepID=A0ABU3X3R3_9EURY|nr:metal-dependent transcriptional regulator [Methanoculleus sp. Wushi-C6]MDV2482703.1 metal-dependent transcriptional regulator [Methanoculleus sp. Wushi-C6]
MLPSAFEDYLEAILTITGDGGRPATLAEIAAALGTGAAAAETTVDSLAEEGYLERVSGDAVRLTAKGSTVASTVARKHRVLQCFLTEMLGVDEAAADKEACTLEHGISDETIERLSSYMGGTRCPPGHQGCCRGREACTLLDCKEGDLVRVAMVRGARRNRRLLDLGIFPGEVVEIRRKLQNKSVVVRVKDCDIAISPEIAASILVESCP